LLRFALDDLDVVYRNLSAHSHKSGHRSIIQATQQGDLPHIPLGNGQIGMVLRS
jgi:hypothetical protein